MTQRADSGSESGFGYLVFRHAGPGIDDSTILPVPGAFLHPLPIRELLLAVDRLRWSKSCERPASGVSIFTARRPGITAAVAATATSGAQNRQRSAGPPHDPAAYPGPGRLPPCRPRR